MTYKYALLLALLALNINFVQQATKPNLYILFKENNDAGMSKQVRKDEKAVIKNGRTISQKYDYDLYTYVDSKSSSRYKLATIDKNNFFIANTSFAKKHAVTFDQIKANKNIYYDSRDFKRFPYKRIFIVEYLKNNQYKVIQVDSYMGSDY